MKVWEKEFNGNNIRVKNRVSGENLIVNGNIQDERMGLATRSVLWGKLAMNLKVYIFKYLLY